MGAVIVLLPADPQAIAAPDGDPIEDLHCTLMYLGDDITDPARIDAITESLARHAQMPPIDAQISGAGILGEDAAVIVILQSQEICDLHDALVAECEQHDPTLLVDKFPGYIPHLTIGYPLDDDEQPNVDLGESLLHHALPLVGGNITFDRLALMNGEDLIEYPLGSPTVAEAPESEAFIPFDEPMYSFGRGRVALAEPPVAQPAAPAGASPPAGAAPPQAAPQRTVILVGMLVKDPAKVPYKLAKVPYMSAEPYVALIEVKLRKNEVPEQLAQVLATVTVEPATSTAIKSLTASDVSPPRRAVLMDPEPLAAASEAIKAALAVYSVNVDDYPFVIQLGQHPNVTKADVTALTGQSVDFENLTAVLQDGTIVFPSGGAPAASPAPATPPTTVAAT